MVTVQSISKYDKKRPTAITIGTFDGVHLGHKKILQQLIKTANASQLQSTLLTFFPHPRMVLQKDTDIKLLNTMEEKQQIMDQIGLECLVIHPFTQEFSRLTALEFVRDILVDSLDVKRIITGYDHRFGRNRNATIKDLIAFGEKYDFMVEEIPAQQYDHVSISSTKIRNALMEGDMKTANTYLGYAYLLTGNVVQGKGLGRKLDFPTANLHIEESYKLIPKNGVYVVRCHYHGTAIFGMMNIGYTPTVSGTEKKIEIHFLDFEGDLYGEKIQIEILERIRDEHKFSSLEALKRQLQKDRETSLSIIPR